MKKLNNLLQSCLAALPVVPKDIIDKISPAQVRILLAKDVLKQLDSKKMIAEGGSWLDINTCTPIEYLEDKQQIVSCFGCALGGLFFSTIDRFNCLKANKMKADYVNEYAYGLPYDFHKELTKYFSISQLKAIELAFEGTSFIKYSALSDRELTEIYKYYTRNNHYNDEDQMRMIMQNIIDNEGTFTP